MMRRQRGFTLIELMVVIAITAIVLMLAVPSFIEFLARRRMEGAAHVLGTDLQYARSLAVDHRVDVSLVTNADGTGYQITGTVVGVLRTFKDVTLNPGVTVSANTTVSYESSRGIRATSGANPTITVSTGGTTATLTLSVDPIGRLQVCSPSGTMQGYPACPVT